MVQPFRPGLFQPAAISPETRAFNDALIKTFSSIGNWWEIGVQNVREARARGEGPFPMPPKSERARTLMIEGKGGRKVPLRVILPALDNPTGVCLHIHGGGWVLGAADLQDAMLERIVSNSGMACASVEYRLAPENPYPAGPDDCEAAALWLMKNSKAEFGTEVLTIGGESAGANLSAVTLLRMRDRHGYTGFKAANLVYGCFDLSMTPSQKSFGDEHLVLRTIDIVKFSEAYLSTIDKQNWRDPDISPLYADLKAMPPALFTIGTRDALLDDSLYLSLSANRLTLFIHDVKSGSPVRKLDMGKIAGPCPVRNVGWLPDNRTLLFTLEEGVDAFMEDADYKRIGLWLMQDDGTALTHLPDSFGVVQEPGYRYFRNRPPVMLGVINGQYLLRVPLEKSSRTPPYNTFLALADPHSEKTAKIVLQSFLSAFTLSRSGRYIGYIQQEPSRFVGNQHIVPPQHVWLQPLPAGDRKEMFALETGHDRGISLALIGWMDE